ncbi:unnamed protein product, partial [Rotaria magnacalcarata]
MPLLTQAKEVAISDLECVLKSISTEALLQLPSEKAGSSKETETSLASTPLTFAFRLDNDDDDVDDDDDDDDDTVQDLAER